MKHRIAGELMARVRCNLKFRIVIFGSHFAPRSREVAFGVELRALCEFLARGEAREERKPDDGRKEDRKEGRKEGEKSETISGQRQILRKESK